MMAIAWRLCILSVGEFRGEALAPELGSAESQNSRMHRPPGSSDDQIIRSLDFPIQPLVNFSFASGSHGSSMLLS